MSPSEIEEYQKQIDPWVPGGDVTMVDVVIHGIVDECVNIANRAIDKMMDGK